MKLSIIPYKSVGPLSWRMKRVEVAQVLGAPTRSSKNNSGNLVDLHQDSHVTCIYQEKEDYLIEVGVLKIEDFIFFEDFDLVKNDALDVVSYLAKRDANPLEGYGSQVFPNLGICLTGYLPEEMEVKAVTAFAHGNLDSLIPIMKPLELKSLIK